MGSSTDIYLVRHAAAVDAADTAGDEQRYLTPKGRKVFQKTADELHDLGVKFDLIVSSPLVRTIQTAELLATGTRYKGEVIAADALAPGGRTMEFLLRLAAAHRGEKIALVGHEPRMGQLAGQLLGRGSIPFRKGQVMRIDFADELAPGSTGRFKWTLLPSGDRLDSLKDLDAA